MPQKKKKYALVLSGGGFKGAYQLGALRYINTHWKQITGQDGPMHFDLVAGVSVGALNGALLASRKFNTLEELWKKVYENGGNEIYLSDYITNRGKIQLSFQQLKKDLFPDFKLNAGIVTKGIWNSVKRTFNKKVPGLLATLLAAAEQDFNENFPKFKALASNKPLEEKLTAYLDLKAIPEDTVYLCGLVSINDGLYYSLSQQDFSDNEDFVQAVLASSSMPVIWPPRPIVAVTDPPREIRNAVDGGIRNISPLGDVVKYINRDPEPAHYELIIVNCNSGYIVPMNESWNIGDIALRTLTEITLAEIFTNDVHQFLKVNRLVRQAKAKGLRLQHKNRELKEFAYTLIQPERNELGATMDSRPEIIRQRELYGHEQAAAAFDLKVASLHAPE